MKIGIIGVGNLGGAIAKGLLKNENFDNKNLYLYNRTSSKLNFYKGKANVCKDVFDVFENSQIIILAIEPDKYKSWLDEYSKFIQEKLFISVGAGITSEFLSKYLSLFTITMPNVASEYNTGYTAICKNPILNLHMEDVLLEETAKVFSYVGKVEVIKEEEIEIYIGLIGSSSAYFFEIINNMSKYFEEFGYDKKKIENTLAYIMEGSSKLIFNNYDKSTNDLVESVCVKGGCTIEAINNFRDNNLEGIIKESIKKCVDKAHDMK